MKLNTTATVPLMDLVDSRESRFTLNGILYDGKTAVVTDGHHLTITRDTSATAEDKPILVSAEVLNAAKRLPKVEKFGKRELQINPNGKPENYQLDALDVRDEENPVVQSSQSFERMTGNFPDYQRCLPNEDDLPFRIAFDARLLVKVLNAMIRVHDADTGNKNAIVPVELLLGNCQNAAKVKLQSSTSIEVESVVMPVKHPDDKWNRVAKKFTDAARDARKLYMEA